MSFISSVRRALGFPDDFDGEDELDDDDLNDDDELLMDDPDPLLDPMPADGSDTSVGDGSISYCLSDSEIKAVASGFFDAVLNYFNAHQPELVQRCIDLDTQRGLIIESMDTALRERLSALADIACRKGESRWAEKQQRMGAELLKLKSEFNAIRQQREDYQSAQLSATRQKRAMTDRIRDLENQVTALIAEREQYQLENKSMAARLLTLPEGSGNSSSAETVSADEIAQLKKELEEATARADSNEATIAELNKRLAEAAEHKSEMSPELVEEFRAMESQIEPLRQLKDSAEAKVIALTKEIKQSDATIASLQKRLGESAQTAEETALEIDKLRSTIESNLYAHAEAEAELRNEIKRLNELLAVPRPEPSATSPTTEGAERPRPKQRRKKKRKSASELGATIAGMTDLDEQAPIKISAIDELMDSTDWFVAPEPIPLKKDPEVEEIFGYKEPPKKTDMPDDDRQLTLW